MKKMLILSHRGNVAGPDPEKENNPNWIDSLKKSRPFNGVEVDVRVGTGGFLYLGHDKPQYVVPELFLEDPFIWCHAKDKESLERLSRNPKIHCFWHEEDNFALTSRGFIWAHPKATWMAAGTVLVHLLPYEGEPKGLRGVCTDYPLQSVRI